MKKIRRVLALLLTLAMAMTICAPAVAVDVQKVKQLSGSELFYSEVESAIDDYVESWVFENFSEHYILSEYVSSIPTISVDNKNVSTTVFVSVFTTLKYTSVESLPYMIGIKNELNISSLAEVVPVAFAAEHSEAAVDELNKSASYAIDVCSASAKERLLTNKKGESVLTMERAVNNLEETMEVTSEQAKNLVSLVSNNFVDAAECIGVPTLLTLDISFSAQYNDGVFSNVVIEQQHGECATESESEIRPLSAEELKSSAASDVAICLADSSVSARTTSNRALADSYDRVAARNYAWEHTAPGYGYNQSNPKGSGYTPTTTCGHVFYNDDGSRKYVYVDRNYWNTTDYPSCMENGHCHDDCACFVSQCMVAGGIDPTDTWKYCSPTWHSASKLIDFITSDEVGGYKTTYASCNAGNIVYWTGHITLCTLNDTITHRYTGHTNDRNNSKFSSATAYYAINLN